MKIKQDTLKKFVEGTYGWQKLSETNTMAMAKELYELRSKGGSPDSGLCLNACTVQPGPLGNKSVRRDPAVGQELYTLHFSNHQDIQMDVWANDEFQAFNLAQALIDRGEVEMGNIENHLSLRYIKQKLPTPTGQ